jgi:hypothetical protein
MLIPAAVAAAATAVAFTKSLRLKLMMFLPFPGVNGYKKFQNSEMAAREWQAPGCRRSRV